MSVTEGIAQIQEYHAKPGSLEAALKLRPELSQYVAQCFAALVSQSPNYTEMKFDVHPANGEWITVTVQKGTGKTPHQMRQSAEYERDAFRRDCIALREKLKKHEAAV